MPGVSIIYPPKLNLIAYKPDNLTPIYGAKIELTPEYIAKFQENLNIKTKIS